MTKLTRVAVFLDRDGVINYNRSDHVKSWSEFEFLPGTLQALRSLAQLPWPIVVVSNQAVIGRGLVSQATIDDVHDRMLRIVEAAGGRIDAVFYCPHRHDEGCTCRKPSPGLLLRAAYELQLNLAKSYLIGDALTDILAANAVSCQPILVKTGRGQEQIRLSAVQGVDGFRVADDLGDAVHWIMRQVTEHQYATPELEIIEGGSTLRGLKLDRQPHEQEISDARG